MRPVSNAAPKVLAKFRYKFIVKNVANSMEQNLYREASKDSDCGVFG